jgi:hypothetical protein
MICCGLMMAGMIGMAIGKNQTSDTRLTSTTTVTPTTTHPNVPDANRSHVINSHNTYYGVPAPELATKPAHVIHNYVPELVTKPASVASAHHTVIVQDVPPPPQQLVIVQNPTPPPPDLNVTIIRPEVRQPQQTITIIDERAERLMREHNARMNEWRTRPQSVAGSW